jgi:cruciform cutting endonuclease 1
MSGTVRPLSESLSLLKNAQLKTLLTRIGSRTSGRKPELVARLERDLRAQGRIRWQPCLPASSQTCPSASSKQSSRENDLAAAGKSGGKATILSVDMGVRNLAFAVCEVTKGDFWGKNMCLMRADDNATAGKVRESKEKAGLSREKSDLERLMGAVEELQREPIGMRVEVWRRIAVPLFSPFSASQAPIPMSSSEPDAEAQNPYNPSSLSRTAYDLVANMLLPLGPDTILIERQRFRSGSQPQIQEWTIRVNGLEGMMWAVLRTLEEQARRRGDSGGMTVPGPWEVSPAHVGSYWIGEVGTGAERKGDVKGKGRKVDKKDKIAIVGRWLRESLPSPSPKLKRKASPISLVFGTEAAVTREAFLARLDKPRGGTKKSDTVMDLGRVEGNGNVKKLDDLADCLLQAAAWAVWERNRVVISGAVGIAGER